MFNPALATNRYRPRDNSTDVDHAAFEARLRACARCPLRMGQYCRPANQLTTVLARLGDGRCPTGQWPGEPATLKRPAPVWRHDAHPAGDNLGPIPATAKLPPEFPPLDPTRLRRNLICHIYPLTSGQKWRRTAAHLCARRHLFDGRKIVSIASDHESDPPADVETALADLGADVEFLRVPNDRNLCEVKSFARLLERVYADRSFEDLRDSITFYCHAKGSTWPESGHPAHEWADAMFATNLDYPQLVCDLLSTAAVCGSFRRTTPLPQSQSTWHYSGTFFWMRDDYCLRPGSPWGLVEQVYAGVEGWPSLQFPIERSACLFMKDDQADLYDPEYWDKTVRPAFRAWRNARH